MNQYKKLSTDTAIFAISNFSSKFLIFLLLPFYTKYLQTAEYGTIDLINNLVSIFFPILTLSIIEGVLRFSFDKNVIRSDILTISIVSITGSIFILGLTILIAIIILGQVKQFWIVFFLIYCGYCISTTLSYYFRGINAVKYVAIQGMLQTIFTVAGNIIMLVILRQGLYGYVFSLIFSYFATTIIMVIISKIYVDILSFHLNKVLLKQILKYCIPMIPSKIAWWMNNSLDKYFIIAFKGLGQSGLYSVAHKVPSILTVITEVFNQAWQLSAIEAYEGDDTDKEFYSTVHQYYLCFDIVGASGLILLSELFGTILFSNDYYIAWKFIPPLIVAAVFSSLSGYYHSIFRAAKMSKELCATVVLGTIFNIILNFLFVPKFGAMGAAYATMLAFAIEWIVSYYYAQRVIRLKLNFVKAIVLYFLLVLEASVTSLNMKHKYYIDIISIFLILFLVKIELLKLLGKLISTFQQKYKL